MLADLQTDHVGRYELGVLQEVVRQRPDLLLLAGDYLQNSDPVAHSELRGALRRAWELAGVEAVPEVLAVAGDIDSADWPAMFEGLSVRACPDTHSVDLAGVRVTALSLGDSRRPALELPTTDPFHIVVGHAPDYALGRPAGDLLVTGHTHGGQVRAPGFGPLLTLSAVPREWASGMTEMANGQGLVVSRGIGMERGEAPRLRLFCRPELVAVDIQPEP